MKKYLIALMGAIVLLSCSDGKIKGEFTADELSWLVYEQGDSIPFTCVDGEEQTLVARSRTDLEQLRDYYPLEAELDLANETTEHEFKIYLLKDKKNFKKYFKIYEVYRSLDLIDPVHITIDGQDFKDVYVVSEDTTDSNIIVWQVYFSKEHGVVKYVTRDNREFITTEVNSGLSATYGYTQ